MIQSFNWDDIRIFLALTRSGSVREASRRLNVTHATVSRRLRILEEGIGVPLFERVTTGLHLSDVGREILSAAEDAEASMQELDRRVFARDTQIAGKVRLSMSETLFLSLLHLNIAAFQEIYPMVELVLESSDQMAKLSQREADVVIRITRNPPPEAVGRRIAESPLGCYASSGYLADRPKLDRWISQSYEGAAKPVIPARISATATSASSVQVMLRNGMGIGMLPCYMGDTDPHLVRVPDTKLISDNTMWVLVHADIKENRRVRVLLDFLYEAMEGYKAVIEGNKPSGRR
ncbi:LysR family transcriptional regulator [uncultured Kiloniella sp.]|uniref:LysR family transcriptional regulator n=1 Tax=uncultured Kiloniella sp. TaxID=1133091 RepID=UPI00262D7527|nr:LysR family transcriptional regulator [uncultured Kiloniella sp.]